MSADITIGLALALAAGLFSGNCVFPMKFVRRPARDARHLAMGDNDRSLRVDKPTVRSREGEARFVSFEEG